MSKQSLDLKKILEMVKNKQIAPKEGFKLIKQVQQGISQAIEVAGDLENSASLYYQMQWEKSEAPAESEKKNPLASVLLFATDEGVFKTIQNLKDYEGNESSVIMVKYGESYRAFGKLIYEINPESREDYYHLIKELRKEELLPSKVIYLRSGKSLSNNEEILISQFRQDVYPVLFLSQAILDEGIRDKIKFLYIYLCQSDELYPQYAAMGGFARSVHLENQRFFFKVIGVRSMSNSNQIANIIAYEFETEDAEAEVLYDGDNRLIRRWKEIETENDKGKSVQLRDRGVYVITGGTGGLGLIFAEYLAKNVRPRLVLVGRSELTADKQKRIKDIEALGADIEYIRADVSKREEVEELIAKIKSRFMEVHGVIHAAGVINDSFVVKKTKEEMDEVLSPKVYGTIWLDELTKEEPLDFFITFSSIAGIIGNIGQCDYAYANSFMNYYAEKRAALGRHGKTLSIIWPLWKKGGMRIDEQTEKLLSDTMGIRLMDRETGLMAIEKGLRLGGSHLIPLVGDTDKIRLRFDNIESLSLLKTDAMQTLTQTDEVSLTKNLQKDMLSLVSDILKIDEKRINLDSSLTKFGFDSITFTELANKINDKYHITIMPTVFFEHSSLRSIVSYLIKEQRDSMIYYYKSKMSVPINALADSLIQKKADEKIAETETIVRSRYNKSHEEFREQGRTAIKDNIAIVGMSGVMPQSEDLEEFWRHLEEGRDMITQIPIDRWDWKEYYGDPITEANKTNIKWGGFMKEVDKFDPLFFNISPYEAELMDPQERIIIELIWKTIEDSGYRALDFSGTKTGLFIGISSADYRELMIEQHMSMGVSQSIIANRVSYCFNFRGPSEPVDTACSSSLVAIHRAVEAIQNGHCDTAFAGGINVIASPNLYVVFSRMGALSDNGKCKTFDKNANGYVRGEGAGILMLKSLSRAEADGDYIYGVIKGTAVNHGGRASFFTAPNPNAQAEVLIEAYERAGVDPSTLSYIETHGTGTSLGDPIEIEGLKKAFKELYKRCNKPISKKAHCGLGSVKTNIGHLEAASGVAGVIKVLLAMKHQRLPGLLNFKEMNPYIQLEGSPFYIITESMAWGRLRDEEKMPIPLRAGVSSFGMGGVNAHVVLEEYRDNNKQIIAENKETQVFVLSAKNEKQLKEYAEKMVKFFDRAFDKKEVTIANIAYTLQVGREAMEERLALIVSSIQDLKEKLSQYAQGAEHIENVYRGNVKANKGISELLDGGEEEHAFIRRLIAVKRISKLAQMWVSGVNIEWKLLHELQTTRRIALPTYPFAREKCWIPKIEQAAVIASNKQVQVTESSNLIHNNYVKNFEQEQSIIPHQIVKNTNLENTEVLFTATSEYFKNVFSSALKIDSKMIDIETDFQEYGLDSIMVNQLNKILEGKFGKLSPTLLFTHKNIKTLTGYFVKNYIEKLRYIIGVSQNNNKVNLTTSKQERQIGEVIKETSNKDSYNEEIAIIGLSGQFPLASNVDELWENLKAGRDCITEVPKERWDYKEFYDPEKRKIGKTCCKWGGFLKEVDKFDPAFFNINPEEAVIMDPQERLFLQTVWACLEDAGYTRTMLKDNNTKDIGAAVGVFVGASFHSYPLHVAEQWKKGVLVPLHTQTFSIANRISYFFNLSGPSVSMDTACSSSLYALHLACESIRRGECRFAITGGVNLPLHPSQYITLSAVGMLSAQGHCRSFGEGADGMVPGEGVDAVLLKPLKDAIRDRDHIYAVIKGTAANNDGKTYGYTTPNPIAQSEVIRKALTKSNVDTKTISYIEAHGTGIVLSDTIEIEALSNAYESYSKERNYRAIGSIKSNIGHIEAPGGIAGLIKVLLQMKYKLLVPSIHSEKLNSHINFENTPFYVQQKLEEWKQPVIEENGKVKIYPRRAGLSSFGAGGVNVHIIVEEYPSFGADHSCTGKDNLIPSASSLINAVMNEVRPLLIQSFNKIDINLYEKGYKDLNKWTRLLLLNAFQNMGLFNKSEERYQRRELVERLNILVKYRQLFDGLLTILTQGRFLKKDGDVIACTSRVESEETKKHLMNLEHTKEDLIQKYPLLKSYLSLLWICISNYPDILTGKKLATTVMFPNSSMELVEGIYKAFSKEFSMVAKCIGSYVKRRCAELGEGEKINILEIGAGTGGTTVSVLEAIEEYSDKIRYVYTDVSIGFLFHGENLYGKKYDFMEFKLLDIEKSAFEQGIKQAEYDIIIGANVFHATKKMDNTLLNVKELLKTNGLLIMEETTSKVDFLLLTFGLLDGWWLYEDKENRIEESPLLNIDSWKRLLEKINFQNVGFLGYQGSMQHMIVAENSCVQRIEYPLCEFKALNHIILPISAMNKQSLYSNAKQLKDFLRKNKEQRNFILLLEDIAYTLQVGREPMRHRLAFTGKTHDEIIEKIDMYLNTPLKKVDMFELNNVSLDEIDLKEKTFIGKKVDAEQMNNLIQQGAMDKLADLWVQGMEVDWNSLYMGYKPSRVSLPTYSFLKERYWVSDKNG
ncbi:SDR family NAD(P)-dependent oxidoreductase [Candidatus Desantisbacteria bacterium]|nr:SDR family NAD(P)-dependent oxidoreductase [Candidatus Desantisbacteria bacterium]